MASKTIIGKSSSQFKRIPGPDALDTLIFSLYCMLQALPAHLRCPYCSSMPRRFAFQGQIVLSYILTLFSLVSPIRNSSQLDA